MSYGYYQLPSGRVAAIGNDAEDECDFPPITNALTEPNGLLAIGGDLSPNRLLSAYQQGIFPWFNEGEPVMWWSPNPRMVLFPAELKISDSLRKRLKKTDYEVRFNTAFREVMQNCAQTNRNKLKNLEQPEQSETWISNQIIEGYCALHQLGYAHSAETWINGELVGGLYGVKIGKMFYGESMFHHVSDASKIAFVHMVQHMQRQGVAMIDCQMKTAHLASLGAREIKREEFMHSLNKLIHLSL